MHKSKRVMALGAAALSVVGLSSALAQSADAAAGAAAAAYSTTLRTVTKGASVSFPTDQQVGTPQGVQSHEFAPDPDSLGHDGARSASAQPNDVDLTGTPVVSDPAAVGGQPGLLASTTGLNAFDQRYANNGNQYSVEPPDQALCANTRYTLEAVNDVLQVFNAKGRPLSPPTDLNSFYGYPAAIDRSTGVPGPFVTDPTCIYDNGTQRFFLVVLTLDVDPDTGNYTGGNHLDLAVSTSSNPKSAWMIYRLAVQDDGTGGTPSHPDCPCLGDYPHIGSDANGVYLTTNEFTFSGDGGVYDHGYNGSQLYAFDKAGLVSGSLNVNVVQFENLSSTYRRKVVPAYSVFAAQVPGTAYDMSRHGTEYLLSAIADSLTTPQKPFGRAHSIVEWRVIHTDTLSSDNPDLVLSSHSVESEVYQDPPLAMQKVGSTPLADCQNVDCLGFGQAFENEGPIATNDAGMRQVYLAGGKLYSALTTGMNVAGKLQAGIAWFVVSATVPSQAAMVNQGYLAVANANLFFPAVAVNSDGTGAMTFTLSGKRYYPSAAYALFSGDAPNNAVHVAGMGRGPQDGFSEYPSISGEDRPRWGDYSAAEIVDGQVRMASEFIAQRCTFSEFQADLTCGHTRGALINWATRITTVNPAPPT